MKRGTTLGSAVLAAWFALSCTNTIGPDDGSSSPAPPPGGGSGSDDVSGTPDDTTPPPGECGPGEGPLYTGSDDVGTIYDPSSVTSGSGGPPMVQTCADTGCAADKVGVEVLEGVICVAPPPTCAAGTYPNWVAEVPDFEDPLGGYVGGFWTCSGPCHVVIHYGGLFGLGGACTEAPPACGSLTATFDYESQAWTCAPMCDGGLYDPVEFQGETVCIPC